VSRLPTKKRIIANIDQCETRIGIMDDERLVEIYVEREERNIGSIYKGRVANVLPGMAAAFVDIGLERNAFLYVGDVIPGTIIDEEEIISSKASISEALKVGQEVKVQITKSPIGTKGARVTTRISLPGRYLVLMPSSDLVGVSRRLPDEAERERLRHIAEKIRPRDMGIIVRTAAEGRSERDIVRDLNFLTSLWKRIGESARKAAAPALIHKEYGLVFRMVRDVFTADISEFIIDSLPEYEKVLDLVGLLSPRYKNRVKLYDGKIPIFSHYGLEEQIDEALKRKVWLKSGGYLIIEEAEALTIIDVNTGRYVGTRDLAHTILTNNLEAVKEIARQLRLRDIGGIIVIDLIDIDNESHRDKVIKAFEKALSEDKTKTSISSISKLGLIEMTRKRVSKSLPALLCVSCPLCHGHGHIISAETMSVRIEREMRKASIEYESGRLVVRVHPQVAVNLIGADGERIDGIEKYIGKEVYVRGDQRFHPETFKIEPESHVKEGLFPFAVGDSMAVIIDSVNPFCVDNGLAWFRGMMIDVDKAGKRVGDDIRIYIRQLDRSFARADITE